METLFIKCLEGQGWGSGREGFLAQDCGLWFCLCHLATDPRPAPSPERQRRLGFSYLWKNLWPKRGDCESEWGCVGYLGRRQFTAVYQGLIPVLEQATI